MRIERYYSKRRKKYMDVVSYEEFYGFFMRSWADIGDIT
jgi:hypothetical protein